MSLLRKYNLIDHIIYLTAIIFAYISQFISLNIFNLITTEWTILFNNKYVVDHFNFYNDTLYLAKGETIEVY